jgi:signal transduction histidine kinase
MYARYGPKNGHRWLSLVLYPGIHTAILFREETMLKSVQSLCLVAVIVCLFTLPANAVTRDEIINKCLEASQLLTEKGLDAAAKMIEDKKGRFVWHNNVNYLFLMNLDGRMLAHPFKPTLKEAKSLLDYADVNGSRFFVDMVKVAKSKTGAGWVRYMWPIPGQEKPIQKYTFIYRVPDPEYFIGSGLYVIKPGEYY